MQRRCFLFALLLVVSVSSGCSINHHIANYYNQYLINNRGNSNLPKTDFETDYHLTNYTRENAYEFRSATVGYANLWIVDFSKILEETLQSYDIQHAFGRLGQAQGDLNSIENLILFDLQDYSFHDFGAHISLRIALFQFGDKALDKTYTADGRTQGGKMFWAGVFGMKNAIHQSTKMALDEIFADFINDIRKKNL